MKKLNPVSIGLAIRTTREAQKLSASDLARQIGVNASTMSRIENGLRGLELQDACAIAVVLNTPLQALIDMAQQLEKSGVVAERIAGIEKLKQSLEGAREAAQQAINEISKG